MLPSGDAPDARPRATPEPHAVIARPEVARNVILFVGDGAGFHHHEAASLWRTGRSGSFCAERFPVRYAVSTHPAGGAYDPRAMWRDAAWRHHEPTDSAAAATALSTGEKTANGRIGVGPEDPRPRPFTHALHRAAESGRATGLVSTVPFAHATPASFAAHHVSREAYAELARALLLDGAIDVLMGCGHPFHDDDGFRLDVPVTYDLVGGEATWNELVCGTLRPNDPRHGTPSAAPWTLVETRGAFLDLGRRWTPERVLGLPQVFRTLQQRRGGDEGAAPFAAQRLRHVPRLAEMVAAALRLLSRRAGGFFLMVEGGAIDWASHDAQAGRLVEEVVELHEAVETALDWMRRQDGGPETLVIVTSDHECGDLGRSHRADRAAPLRGRGRRRVPAMAFSSPGHTQALVPLWARGPGSRAFDRHVEGIDPVRGPWVDNTAVGRVLAEVLRPAGERAGGGSRPPYERAHRQSPHRSRTTNERR